MPDCVAERGEFELPVPVCEQSDDSIRLGFATSRRTAKRSALHSCQGEDVRGLVSRPVNKCSVADAAFDLMGGFGPAEGFGIFVPVGQEAGDGLLQARDAVEAAPAYGLRGDQAEPALDLVGSRVACTVEVTTEQ